MVVWRERLERAVRVAVALLLCAGLAGLVYVSPVLRGLDEKKPLLRIAAPGGIAGELVRRTGEYLHDGDAAMPAIALSQGAFIELLQVRDCCAATVPWALGSQALQGAIMCPDAARVFLQQNPHFVLLGTVLVNSDAFVEQDVMPVGRELVVGISHKRAHQVRMARSRYGDRARLAPMLPQALTFALHDGAVDAIILDIGSALALDQKITPWRGDAVETQVLVVSREFYQSPEFGLFAEAYERARHELENKYRPQRVTLPAVPVL